MKSSSSVMILEKLLKLPDHFAATVRVLFLIISFVFISIIPTSLLGQNASTGRISGILVDAETGDPLIGANVYLDSTTIGAGTDLDGSYVILNVPEGTYTLVVSMLSYSETRVIGVEVKANETKQINLSIQPESLTGETVTVEARVIENTEALLLKKRQRSNAVSDAISAEAISRSGSGDAAEAMKKVTGASVVDGKYVFVRGLGERYSSTQLNGAELPSSDPDKKAFQLDLLPSNLLDNIVTLKTFTPDKPGNFTGGIVDVGTKSFPEELTLKASTSSSYNDQANYNNNYLTYDGGDKDWLGYDDGTRDLPEILANPPEELSLSSPRVQARFDPEKAALVDEAINSLNSNMDIKRESVPFNKNFSFSIGNRINVGKNSALGYLGSLTYSRSFSFYENGEVGRYTLPAGADELNPELLVSDSKGTAEANWGALTNLVFNINPSHQIGTNFFYSKSGISSTRFQIGKWPHQYGLEDDSHIWHSQVLSFLERDVRSLQFTGEHYFGNLLGLNSDWTITLAKTSQDEPDRRMLAYFMITQPDTFYSIKSSNWDQPSRYFRYLDDNKNTYNLNFSLPFNQWSGFNSKFKFGFSYQQTDRNFEEKLFQYDIQTGLFTDVGGDVSKLFSSEHNGIIGTDTLSNGRVRYNFGNLIKYYENPQLKNNYTGDEKIQAAYGMFELPITRRFKFIGGLRYETTNIEVVSRDTTLDKGKVDKNDLLPSLNLMYELKDNMNLRFAATRTLARPNFRELAPYSTKEFINDWELVGNPELKRTLINNFDLRWEWFTRPGEILAISGFYKRLRNPIELVIIPESASANLIVQYRNVDLASILGLEIEARIGLDHFTRYLGNFSMGTNLSIIKSTVDIDEAELKERRDVAERAGLTVKDTRVLQGQSDYIFNLDFTYRNRIGTVASIYFNTFGERLAKVSSIITPDVYEQPADELDFLMSQTLFQKYSLKFAVKNILNSSYREIFKFNGKEYTALEYKRGLTYSVGLEYNF